MHNTKKERPTINLGILRKHLQIYSDDYEVSFGGLEFYRPKETDRINKIVNIEFSQAVYLNDQGDVVVENH